MRERETNQKSRATLYSVPKSSLRWYAFFSSSFLPALYFSNPPSASFCCSILVWFNFRAYLTLTPSVSRPVVDWVELVVAKFPFHQNWF